ncbi:Type IV fimbrial biogenesis protein PilV [Pseudohaliea rubra DSM 19751]|uniref:Type IV fimbrial biogenesis protein PilV n=1 Tax=Pseudohaliea rubra DSM 19751 TaxID=1265313 RepID=A0A095WZV1_9GAMM|nr:Type IV fimbrial biogenesis protein PilV [Pseudohaliea rubra DSM 19751]
MAGVTLIEVLVTLLILAIGLLGLAGLQLTTVNGQFEAYQRSQALLLAEEMAGRLRANATVARDPNSPYTADAGTTLYGVGSDECTAAMSIARRDLCEWNNRLLGTSTTRPGDPNEGLASIISARGCIDRLAGSGDGDVAVQVTVAWQGLVETSPPSLPCAQGQYGDERLRRAVATRVVFAELVDPNSP